jgi:hypothetical protein
MAEDSPLSYDHHAYTLSVVLALIHMEEFAAARPANLNSMLDRHDAAVV